MADTERKRAKRSLCNLTFRYGGTKTTPVITEKNVVIMPGLASESLNATLRAVFPIPAGDTITGFSIPGENLIPISVVCGMPSVVEGEILRIFTSSERDTEEVDEDVGLLKVAMEMPLEYYPKKAQANGIPTIDLESPESPKYADEGEGISNGTPGYVILASGPRKLTELLETHVNEHVVVAILSFEEDSTSTFSVRSTLRALSKRLPALIFIETDICNITGSTHAPSYGSVLPIFRFFVQGRMVNETHGGSPTELAEATLDLSRGDTVAPSAHPYAVSRTGTRDEALNLPPPDDDEEAEELPPLYVGDEDKQNPQYAYDVETPIESRVPPPLYGSPAAAAAAASRKSKAETEEEFVSPVSWDNANPQDRMPQRPYSQQGGNSDYSGGAQRPLAIATAPPLPGEERRQMVLDVLGQLKDEGYISPSQSDALTRLISTSDQAPPEVEEGVHQLLMLARQFVEKTEGDYQLESSRPDEDEKEDGRAAAMEYEYSTNANGLRDGTEDPYDKVMGHVDEKGAAINARELADLRELLEVLIQPMISTTQISPADAEMLRIRVEEKDDILLGTLLNHKENGDIAETKSILLKIVHLNELAQDFKTGLHSLEVRMKIFERFYQIRALSRKEVSLLKLLAAERDPELEMCFQTYSQGKSTKSYRNPAWLLERLVEILGEVSEDEDEDEDADDLVPSVTNGYRGLSNGGGIRRAPVLPTDASNGKDDILVEDEQEGKLQLDQIGGGFELRTLLNALVSMPDVTQDEIKGIVYLITSDPPSSLMDVLQAVRTNIPDEDAVTILVQAYRHMKADGGGGSASVSTPDAPDEDDEDEMYEIQRDQGFSSNSHAPAPSAPTQDTDMDEMDESEREAAFQSLKKLILTACLESRDVTQESLMTLYRLAESYNPTIWAAYSLYRTDQDWEEFKDTLERLIRRKVAAGEYKRPLEDVEREAAANEYARKTATIDSMEERERTVGALVLQQDSCVKEMKVLSLFQQEGYLEEAETDHLKNMVRARDPVIMAAFDVLRETQNWRETYDTMCRLLRREAAQQLVTKYQDIYQSAVFSLLRRGEVDSAGALTLLRYLEDKNEQVIDWLGELETFHSIRGEPDKVPNLIPLVRRVADMALDPLVEENEGA